MKEETEDKYFNGRKYFLSENRFFRASYPQIKLSHDVWNFFHPEDRMKEGGGAIHHINEIASDDRIENLKKMNIGEHSILHNTGRVNSMLDKHISEKTKEKISKSHEGMKASEEAKRNMRDNHRDVSGENNPGWKGGVKNKDLYLGGETVEKQRYYIYQYINSLGEIGNDGFVIQNRKEK